jgi:hypothetical protein
MRRNALRLLHPMALRTPLHDGISIERFGRVVRHNRHGRKLRHEPIAARVARGDGFGELIARSPRFHSNSRGARFLYERQPDGVLDREALHYRQPFGKSFGFLTIFVRLMQINKGLNIIVTKARFDGLRKCRRSRVD